MRWMGCFVLLFVMGCFAATNAQESKVALLFLTVGDLNFPELWKKALKGNEDKFSIYVHSKNGMNDPYFRRYRIAANVPTSWSIHMRAWQELLKEAVRDQRNEKFIFLSESCIPLRSLNYIYKELGKTDKTYMSYGSAWWLSHNRVVNEVPEPHRFVNQEWIILNRRHAAYFAEDNFVIHFATRHDMDIESYPAVYLSLRGELNDENVINHFTTYVNWEHHNAGDASPYNFMQADPFTLQLFEEAKKSGCFFARKFISSFPENLLTPLIFLE